MIIWLIKFINYKLKKLLFKKKVKNNIGFEKNLLNETNIDDFKLLKINKKKNKLWFKIRNNKYNKKRLWN